MSEKAEVTNAIVSIFNVVLSIASLPAMGFVGSVLWKLEVVNTFGVKPISSAQVVGLSLFYGLFKTPSFIKDEFKEPRTLQCIALFLGPWVILGIALIVEACK